MYIDLNTEKYIDTVRKSKEKKTAKEFYLVDKREEVFKDGDE